MFLQKQTVPNLKCDMKTYLGPVTFHGFTQLLVTEFCYQMVPGCRFWKKKGNMWVTGHRWKHEPSLSNTHINLRHEMGKGENTKTNLNLLHQLLRPTLQNPCSGCQPTAPHKWASLGYSPTTKHILMHMEASISHTPESQTVCMIC